MNKKFTGITLVVLGSIPFIMRLLPLLGLGPGGGPNGSGRPHLPSGGMPPEGLPSGGMPPGGPLGMFFGPYVLILGIIFIVIGIILLTHKHKSEKK